jgi:hypothetical protein
MIYRTLTVVLTFVLLVGFSTVTALAQTTGTVTGVVSDTAGVPQPSIKVYLVSPIAQGGGAVGPNAPGSANDQLGIPEPSELQAKGGTKIAETVTDTAGRFTFANIKPGPYQVVVGKLQGGARFPVRVEAGKTVEVDAKVKPSQLK